ncbi:MAG: hypothetical protein ACRCWP_12560 [Shewanella sp.]
MVWRHLASQYVTDFPCLDFVDALEVFNAPSDTVIQTASDAVTIASIVLQ